MQRAAGCCRSVSSLAVGDVPPAPIPLPRAAPPELGGSSGSSGVTGSLSAGKR